MAIAEYKALVYPGITTQSQLKQDDNGYYYCIVGAFDCYSRNGPYYPCTDGVKKIFDQSSAFMRRVHEKNCRGELDHPNIFGMSLMQILNRLSNIDGARVCVHYKHFELVPSKDENGKPIILVYAWLKPEEPYGNVLESRLNNRDSNCAFSVRSYTMESIQKGVKIKEITSIVTYDAVDGSGMKITNKCDTLSLGSGMEGLIDTQSLIFTDTDLEKAILSAKSTGDTGMESEHSKLVHVRDSMGWNSVQVIHSSFMGWQDRI